MFKIEWIRERVAKNEYYISKHGDRERQNDNLTITELEDALLGGRILEHYEDAGRGESCLVAGLYKYRQADTHSLWSEGGLAGYYHCLYPTSP